MTAPISDPQTGIPLVYMGSFEIPEDIEPEALCDYLEGKAAEFRMVADVLSGVAKDARKGEPKRGKRIDIWIPDVTTTAGR